VFSKVIQQSLRTTVVQTLTLYIIYHIIFNLLRKQCTRISIEQYKFEQDNQAHGALIVAQKSRPSKHLSYKLYRTLNCCRIAVDVVWPGV